MRSVGVLIALAVVTSSAFLWGSYSDRTLERERFASPTIVNASKAEPVAETDNPRVFSAKQPLLNSPHLDDYEPPEATASAPVTRRWATVTTAAKEEPAPATATVSKRSSRMTSLRPGDEDARAQLVRDIQYELKRAGCYSGDVNGSWTTSTKQAMQHFNDRVNARLPLEQPDYVLLALLQNEHPNICNSKCPAGQLAGEDGRCVPRALMANRRDGSVGITGATDGSTIPGRMAIGGPADAVIPGSAVAAIGADPAVGENPDVQADAPQTVRPSKPRSRIQRGSTRQIFSKLMQTAP